MRSSFACFDPGLVRNWERLATASAPTREEFQAALRAIEAWPGYRPTPVVALPRLARALDLAGFAIKNEDLRFDVHSFKALGPPLALARVLRRLLRERWRIQADEAAILSGAHRARLAALTVTAASSGNHGRALAWAAEKTGCRCVIFMGAHVGGERERNIAGHGAEVRRVAGGYDDALEAATAAARQPGWLLIAERATPEHPGISLDHIKGYGTIGVEIAEQYAGRMPSHLFVSGGSGSLAAGIAAALVHRPDVFLPRLIVVQPVEADGLVRSARSGDRLPTLGSLLTVLDGLAVRWPGVEAWPILRDAAFAFMTVPDAAAMRALRLFAEGPAGDPPLRVGETGIAAAAAALVAAARDDVREALEIDAESRVLALACEGVTDLEAFERALRAAEMEGRA